MATNESLTLIAVLKAKAGQEHNLKNALKVLIQPTREEPGCRDYALFQLKEEPGTFYMRESWQNQQALDVHVALPHFQAFVGQMDSLLAEPLRLVQLEAVEV